MTTDTEHPSTSADLRRQALRAFLEEHRESLKNVSVWAKEAGASYTTVNDFIRDKGTDNMRADTYEKLAAAAGRLIGRPVAVAELMGHAGAPPAPPDGLQYVEPFVVALLRAVQSGELPLAPERQGQSIAYLCRWYVEQVSAGRQPYDLSADHASALIRLAGLL